MHFYALGWHPPHRVQAASLGDTSAYLGALLEVRLIPNLPLPPMPVQKSRDRADTESGPDLKLFMALAEFARLTSFVPNEPTPPTPSVEVTVDGQSFTLNRPTASAIKAEADKTLDAMSSHAAAKMNELIAQSQDVDAFILDALNIPADGFPATHTLLRTALMCASQVCFKAKDLFRVERPSQFLKGKLIPILPLPPHSSYPGGHATQAGAVIRVLAHLLKTIKRATGRPDSEGNGGEPGWHALEKLAKVIATNRQIAGLHYEFDNDDGLALGFWVADRFIAVAEAKESPCPLLKTLWVAAKEEIKQAS